MIETDRGLHPPEAPVQVGDTHKQNVLVRMVRQGRGQVALSVSLCTTAISVNKESLEWQGTCTDLKEVREGAHGYLVEERPRQRDQQVQRP